MLKLVIIYFSFASDSSLTSIKTRLSLTLGEDIEWTSCIVLIITIDFFNNTVLISYSLWSL